MTRWHHTPWLPRLAGLLTAAIGAANVLSALTPVLPARAARLAQIAPAGVIFTAHALVLPAGLALLVLSVYLARRRRRALWLVIGILASVGGLELLKGLEFEEALASFTLAGLLAWRRDAFRVRHGRGTLPTALRRVGIMAGVVAVMTAVSVLAAAGWATPALTPGLALRETFALLTLSRGPLHLDDAFAWLPLSVGLLSGGALTASAWALFRPLRSPRSLPSTALRAVARRIVHQHGHDTLAAFKLREDVQTLVSRDGCALLSYRVEAGVLVVSGDPVGPDAALAPLVDEMRAFADERGLRVAVVGASDGFAALARRVGMHALYLGDEAIVATSGFSLEGRPIKKVRQAVNRLTRAGYESEARVVGSLRPAELSELEALSERWRAGAPERGFSMAMEGLRGEHLADSMVIVARDAGGAARGFLHFVPTYGRAAMSLSAMRRDRDTPNGLSQFLVVRAIGLLGEQGIDELSLNFAAFARWLHSPNGRVERVLARVVRRADAHFQIESLYRFNARFGPRWQPRYLLHDGVMAVPRTVVAVMWAEGHLPRPALPQPPWARSRRARPTGLIAASP